MKSEHYCEDFLPGSAYDYPLQFSWTCRCGKKWRVSNIDSDLIWNDLTQKQRNALRKSRYSKCWDEFDD